jgi:hypothetical protein
LQSCSPSVAVVAPVPVLCEAIVDDQTVAVNRGQIGREHRGAQSDQDVT